MKDGRTFYVYTDGLTVGYDGVPLISDIRIGVRRGEILTLIGPNGSGKSTILKSIIRQLALIAGTVVLGGQDIGTVPERELAKKMSILMTERVRTEYMTCRDVVATGRYPYTGKLGLLSEYDHAVVDEAVRLVHAEEFAETDFTRVSDGQRQRILLARAICQEPDVLVLDEPTSYLDIRHKMELLDILKTLVRDRDLAVVMSLHELDLAQKISDTVVCVGEGGIDRCGPPEEIFRDDYIRTLYGMEKGSYNALYGCTEMEPPKGDPKVFVIGGGGSGIPVYRLLVRKGIPFAAGVLSENDIDYPAAKALAAEVVSVPAFEPVGEEAYKKALGLMRKCGRAVCVTESFGKTNVRNLALKETAAEEGLLAGWKDLRGAGAAEGVEGAAI
ncbi:MAG: ATP-binding cassette domain-containing protein [Lachnospiraceae bacterium]|nr:ATP-binding cassette domain-containing protein [Lachnospiraceae bacterium]